MSQVRPLPPQSEPRASHGVTWRFAPPATPSLAVQGKYSIERLLALETYSRTKTYWHILWVVLWVPLVPVLIILVYQLPRLAPPEAGLRANWVYVVVRGGISVVMICECSLKAMRTMAPELDSVLTLRKGLLYIAFTAVVYMALIVAFSVGWGFPVPFGPSIINPIASVVGMSTLYSVVRPLVRQNSKTKQRFMVCLAYSAVFSFASLAYPAYMALFIVVGEQNPSSQPFVTVLIVCIKLLMRKMMAYAARELEDLVPVVLIFSVEFFSSLYQVVSVQTGSSIATTAAIMVIDFTFTVRSQWKLHYSTRTLRQMLKATQATDLLPVVAAVCREPQSLQSSSVSELLRLRSIQLYSTVPNDTRAPDEVRQLEKISKAGVFSSSSPIREPRSSNRRHATTFFVVSIRKHGFGRGSSKPNIAKLSSIKPTDPAIDEHTQSAVVIESTAMLFRSELLLLAEYLECMIPLFYAINLVLLWLSPNGKYNPHTASIKTTDQLLLVLLNIAALFAMEVVSFVLLNWVLHKRLHFSPLHQLGFVLDHQTAFIRANMLFVLVLSLQFNVEHAGTDFSFQFKWLHKQS